jgi:hypothetical protein
MFSRGACSWRDSLVQLDVSVDAVDDLAQQVQFVSALSIHRFPHTRSFLMLVAMFDILQVENIPQAVIDGKLSAVEHHFHSLEPVRKRVNEWLVQLQAPDSALNDRYGWILASCSACLILPSTCAVCLVCCRDNRWVGGVNARRNGW